MAACRLTMAVEVSSLIKRCWVCGRTGAAGVDLERRSGGEGDSGPGKQADRDHNALAEGVDGLDDRPKPGGQSCSVHVTQSGPGPRAVCKAGIRQDRLCVALLQLSALLAGVNPDGSAQSRRCGAPFVFSMPDDLRHHR